MITKKCKNKKHTKYILFIWKNKSFWKCHWTIIQRETSHWYTPVSSPYPLEVPIHHRHTHPPTRTQKNTNTQTTILAQAGVRDEQSIQKKVTKNKQKQNKTVNQCCTKSSNNYGFCKTLQVRHSWYVNALKEDKLEQKNGATADWQDVMSSKEHTWTLEKQNNRT